MFISKYLHLATNNEWNYNDPLKKSSDICCFRNKMWKEAYKNPGNKIVVDETIIKFQGRLKFPKYLKNKPFRGDQSLFDLWSWYRYCLGSVLYTGKNSIELINDFSITESIVFHLSNDYVNKGKFYISIIFFKHQM